MVALYIGVVLIMLSEEVTYLTSRVNELKSTIIDIYSELKYIESKISEIESEDTELSDVDTIMKLVFLKKDKRTVETRLLEYSSKVKQLKSHIADLTSND